jgi:hypothetical protein
MEIKSGSSVILERALLDGNVEAGMVLYDRDTTVELVDATIQGTHSRTNDLRFGQGVCVQGGARLDFLRGSLLENREAGLTAYNTGTEVNLERVTISESLRQACVELPPDDPLSCATEGLGIGLGAYRQATVKANDCAVSGSELAGIQLAEEGSLLSHGMTIRDNPIGVSIQDVPGSYDFFDSVTGLWMEDNRVNFDSTELPVPDPLEVIER